MSWTPITTGGDSVALNLAGGPGADAMVGSAQDAADLAATAVERPAATSSGTAHPWPVVPARHG